MSDYEWTDEMGEISGFGGDGGTGDKYEEACRAMVIAGAEWLDEQGESFEIEGGQNSRAVLEEYPDLDQRMVEACKEQGKGGPSGAMIHTCVRHVYYISQEGWGAYVEKMEEKE